MDERTTIADLERRLATAEAALREKYQVEAALRRSEELRRIAVAGGRMGTWRWNLRDEHIWGDAAFLGLWGFPPSDEPRRLSDFVDRMSLQGRAEMSEMITRAVAAGEEFDGQLAIVSGPTVGRWVRWRGRAEPEQSWLVNGVSFDVTAQRLADERLRASEERYRAFVTASSDAVYRMSSDWLRMHQLDGRGFLVDTGGPDEDWIETYILPADRPHVLAAIEASIRDRRVFELEHRVRRVDGSVGWTLSRAVPIFAEDGVLTEWIGAAHDVTGRKRAEAALRESEERQAFLLTLSDALRPLRDAGEIQRIAARLIGEHWGVNAHYAPIETIKGEDYFVVQHAYAMPGREPFNFNYAVAEFPGVAGGLLSGVMAVADVAADPRLTASDKAGFVAAQVGAYLIAPLVKNGRLDALFSAHVPQPRAWNEAEETLMEETAERTWAAVERARAEVALWESEARFQQFAKASSGALWVRDAATLKMEYVSPAISSIYGVDPETFLNGVESWAASIVPEDRDLALAHVEEACRGEAVVHEFRIQRASDRAFRWIRNTDFPLHDEHGRVQRIGGIAEDVTEAKTAVEHQGVLLAELQHRVRNIMAMIHSMANRTASGAATIEDYRSLLEGRLLALARVQALLTREANAGGSLRGIIESEVVAQAHQADQFALTGPDIELAPKAVEVLTLAFHELATNALKYGALSVPEGRLAVSWTPFEKRGELWLALDWVEDGAPPRARSTRRGFGSELIEARIPYELGGRGKLEVGPEGARCHLEFPLRDGESILETDAPQPATIFGGTLDMTGAPDLAGRTVLVVEDDYYMANDTAAALRGAGATVLGPCPSVEATQDLLEGETPTHAVLDLNLGGGGPRFEIARMLKESGVPFIFLTGYDPDVIPKELETVFRLQKPVPFRAIVEAIAQL